MSRSASEVTEEIRAAGWRFVDKDDIALAKALAERLDEGEQVVDALPGRRWFPDTFATFVGWLIVTEKRVFAMAMDQGGWFSGPSVRAASQLLFSDVLDVGFEFTSGKGQWAGKEAHDITIKTLAVTEHLNVPLDWANVDRVRQFLDGLRARCSGIGILPGASPKRSFADELKLLSDLKAKGLLNGEEVAEAIRKLMGE